jgi:carboxyl-terminal processing protease
MTLIGKASIALMCALIPLCLGLWLGGHPDSLPESVRDAFVQEDRAVRAEILDTIGDDFYREVDEEELERASLKGIVRALDDPFSHYLTPREAQEFEQSVEGEFEGVGMTVEEDERGLRVLNVFEDTPAREAGIRKGDLITAVDGKSIAGLNSEAATGRIKGPAGTTVTLGVTTPRSDKERDLRVRRERIEVPVARGRIVERDGRKLAVIELISFTGGAHGLLRQEIDGAFDKGAEGMVLDLRGNGGGLLREAVLVSSIFIEDGEIVSVRGRAREGRTEEAQGTAIDEDVPVAVLVDGGSASASEIVAGTLRDHERATLVGTNTFGKGLVQEVQPLSNGGVLDLTVARYYLPSGRTITMKGIAPQVKARDKPRTERDEALRVALETLLER